MTANKFIKNTSWILGGNIFQMIISLFVGVITARYLGPSNYGTLSYTASIIAFFSSFSTLGLNNIIVNELLSKKERQGEILGTCIYLRLITSSISIVCIYMLLAVINADDPLLQVVALIQSASLFFQTSGMISYWYQSRLESKRYTIITSIAYVIMTIYKVIILMLGKNLLWFAFANTLECICIALMLYIAYLKGPGQKLTFSKEIAKSLLMKSYPFIVSGLMVSIYGQIDKVMIGQMLSETSVGYYSIAAQICAMWTFILAAIIDSARPIIIDAKQVNNAHYEKRLIQLYAAIIWISVIVSIGITLFAPLIISILYGADYMPSVNALRILTWCTAFSHLGVAKNIWLISENKQIYAQWLCAVGAISNIILNYMLIPYWGIIGASIATLFTQVITNFITPIIIKDLRGFSKHTFKAVDLRNSISKDNIDFLLKQLKSRGK